MSRSMRCVIVVRARDFKISIRIYTHTRTTCSYLCPAWGVKLEKRLDVCAHGKRASLSVYHGRTINIQGAVTPILAVGPSATGVKMRSRGQ